MKTPANLKELQEQCEFQIKKGRDYVQSDSSKLIHGSRVDHIEGGIEALEGVVRQLVSMQEEGQ